MPKTRKDDDEPIDGEPDEVVEPAEVVEPDEVVDEVVEPTTEDGEWRYDRDADDPKDEGAEEWTRPPVDEVADE